ncbi:MAG: hypothetical protein VYD70_04010 [Planctomycetota bacterium]|nr:hypothetical protein [Planctomycetota bacterium]
MTDDKKHDDKNRKKVSDEELEDVAGGSDTSDLSQLNTDGSMVRFSKKQNTMQNFADIEANDTFYTN